MRDFSFIAQVVEVGKVQRAVDPDDPGVDISLGCAVSEGFKICVRVLAASVDFLVAGKGEVRCCTVMSPQQPSGDCTVAYHIDALSGDGSFTLQGPNVHAVAFIPAGLNLSFKHMLQNLAES